MKIELNKSSNGEVLTRLNPCSNGMKIEFIRLDSAFVFNCSLNPCCNGMKIEYVEECLTEGDELS